MDPLAEQEDDSPLPPRGRAARVPFVERKRAERRHARARAATLASVPLTAEQQARDPLPPLRHSFGWRSAIVVGMLLGSIAAHVVILVVGFAIGGREPGRREKVRQEVKIEVKEKKVEPPPPPVEKPPEPERRMRTPPKVVETPEPPEKKPPPSKAPPRVVGLSFESTTEGGEGPAFAVGNTREGKTAEKAQAPAEVPKVAPPVAEVEDTKVNKAASRIPVAGVKYTAPKRKNASKKPPYPETLKAQGIEGDVSVMLSLDETGKVVKVKIVTPSPYPEFNEQALKSGYAEEMEPAMNGDTPIAQTITFTYRWRLEDE